MANPDSKAQAAHTAGGRVVLRVLTLLGIVWIAALTSATPALAHAEITTTRPAAGERLASSPKDIELAFNEQVQTDQSQLRLLDSQGNTAAVAFELENQNGSEGKPVTTITLTPQEPLTQGNWITAWTVVSEDGHIVSGALSFEVGMGAAGSAQGGAAGVGSATIEKPASQPGQRERASEIPSRALEGLGWLGGIAAAMLLAGSSARKTAALLGGIGAAAAALYGLSIALAMPNLSVAINIGEVRAAALSAAAGLAALVGAGLAAKKTRQQAGALGLLLFSLQGLWAGHHLIDGNIAVTVAHVTHLGAGAAWIGAVAALYASVTTEQVNRTRRQATVAVVLLIPAAVILTIGTSRVLENGLQFNQWALVLTMKVALVLAALSLGLINHRALSKTRLADTLAQPRKLAKFMRVEIVAMALVIAASATLTLYTPTAAASSQGPGAQEQTVNPQGEAPQASEQLKWPAGAQLQLESGTTLELTITKQTNDQALVKLHKEGTTPENSGAVELTAQGPAKVKVTAYLEPATDGWEGTLSLPMAGHWVLDGTIPIDAFSQEKATGHIDISQTQTQTSTADTTEKETTP